MNSVDHVVVVGAGHAGGRVVQHLRELGFDQKISLIGDEPHFPYERPALSKELLLGTQEASTLTLAPQEFWGNDSSCHRIMASVVQVQAGARHLRLDNGQEIAFDVLVLATGGQPRKLAIPGGDLPGVVTLRTLDDALALKKRLQAGSRLVVIGAGVIGMEVAASAVTKGVEVTVLEHSDRILGRCLSSSASTWLQSLHENQGVTVRTGMNVQSISKQADGSLGIEAFDLQSGRHQFIADTVLMAVGIDCQLDYLKGSGITVDNGVVVDDLCRSLNMPWVYAVGDVASMPNVSPGKNSRLETWRNAENQARAVAEFICHVRTEPYRETPWMWTDQYDHNIQVVGIPDSNDQIVFRGNFKEGVGSQIWLRNNRVVGGVLLNNPRDRRPLEELVKRQAPVDAEILKDTTNQLKTLL